MKKRTKDLIILVPLISFGLFIGAGTWYSTTQPLPEQYIAETTCQEGWIKYELKSGTLCSKTPLTPEELSNYES